MSYREVLEKFETRNGDYCLEAEVFGEGEPKACVVAGVHGDEVLSRRVAEEIKGLDEEDLSGGLAVISDANVFACGEDRRLTPWPEVEQNEGMPKDLNRCFGRAMRKDLGRLNITQQLAKRLVEFLKGFDFVLDLHTATRSGVKIGQCRYRRSDDFSSRTVERMRSMAESSGVNFVMASDGSVVSSEVLSANLPRLGVPTITFELGGGSFSSEDVERYQEYVRNVLISEGVLEGEVAVSDEQEVFDGMITVFSEGSGVVKFLVSLGDHVSKDQPVLRLEGDENWTICSPCDGFVESFTSLYRVFPGEKLFSVGRKG